jgi:superoxide dismutase, Cu-Zn family
MKNATWRVGPAIVAIALVGGFVLTSGSPAGAAKPLARATLQNAAGQTIGTVVFSGTGHYAERVEVELALPADAPGLGAYHGIHVHTTGTCTAPAFTSANGHWNLVEGATHGSHTGDMPSVLVSPSGLAYAEFETHRFDVTQLFDGDGSAVVLHAGPDNFGNVPIGDGKYQDPSGFYGSSTSKTGDAGSRYGCGLVQATA